MADAKVLIVEDEVIVAMGLERSLGSFGYDVVGLATKGEDAIRMAGELMPDLALIDINLEDNIDGIDVAEKIGDNWDIPVVYLTSYTGDETLSRAIRTNPYGYLTKPARPREIYTTIETVLQKHRAIKAEKALKSGEDKFRFVMDSLPFPLCIVSEGDFENGPKISYSNRLLIAKTKMDAEKLSSISPGILLGFEFSKNLSKEKKKSCFECETSLKTSDRGNIPGKIYVKAAVFEGKTYLVVLFQEYLESKTENAEKVSGNISQETDELISLLKQPLSEIIAISGLFGGVESEEVFRNAEKMQNIILEFEKRE